MTRIDDQVVELVAEGWRVVQRGRVLIPFEAKFPKPTFAARVEGYRGDWIKAGDRLIDNDEEWAHLRRLS